MEIYCFAGISRGFFSGRSGKKRLKKGRVRIKMKRRGLDGRFPRKPEPIENPIRGFARAAFSFWTGRQVSILFATFFFCSVVLFPGAYIGLMGLSMRRSPAWEPDEQGTDSIKRVFRLSGKNRFPRMFRSFVRVLPGRGATGHLAFSGAAKQSAGFFAMPLFGLFSVDSS